MPNNIYIDWSSDYPDTLAFRHTNPTPSPQLYKVKPGHINNYGIRVRSCWEDVFDYGVRIPSDTLMVFCYSAEVLESTPWDTVVENYMVLKRYDLSLQDLENMDWKITYP